MTGAIPSERCGHTAVAVGAMMYIWGGHQNGRYFNELLAFNTATCKLMNLSCKSLPVTDSMLLSFG